MPVDPALPPLDPEAEARARARIAAQPFLATLGVVVERIGVGGCDLGIARDSTLLQGNGFFHGGVTATLIDAATTIAAGTLLRPGQSVLTAEYKLSLLSPGTGARLIARARVVKPGRMLTVVAADVVTTTEEGGERLTATALATIAVVETAAIRSKGPG